MAVIGGGFTGLAAACWLRRLAPQRSVALLEAGRFGQGASGRTGGVVLDETAGGELPGLGPVLEGFVSSLAELRIDCHLRLSGVWEISRREGRQESPLDWRDSGLLRVADEVPGGALDPGRLLTGLARRAQASGVALQEQARVKRIKFTAPLRLELEEGEVQAEQALLGVNGSGLELLPWLPFDRARFTLAVATAPLSPKQRERLGMTPGKPFYTLELPYLWGRPLGNERLIFGGGLVGPESPPALQALDVRRGEPARLLASLEERVRGLVPGLESVEFTHRWGAPILFAPAGRPILCRDPRSERVLVLGGYTGQGVALSVYLARWAAAALLEQRELPEWGQVAS
ncbi:MAG: NAD(P)/FAD-dependent oxidoreductase [Terriglobia bacterium]